MKLGFAEKQFFKLRKLFFSRMLGLLPSRPVGFELPIFKSEDRHANHCATGALLSRNFAFWLSLFPLAAKGWV
jgi:hypothetical protein